MITDMESNMEGSTNDEMEKSDEESSEASRRMNSNDGKDARVTIELLNEEIAVSNKLINILDDWWIEERTATTAMEALIKDYKGKKSKFTN